MKIPFFDLDGRTLTDTRALRVATRPGVLGSYGVEEDTNPRGNESLGRPNEEAVRKSISDPSDEDPRGLSKAQATGHRRRAGKKIRSILGCGDHGESGRKTAFRDGRVRGGGQ